jgi:uncharacterized protein YxjI
MSTITAAPPSTRTCPKCSYRSDLASEECPACGVVIAKFQHAEELAETVTEVPSATAPSGRLARAERLFVKQVVERLEMWTGFETANQYVVKDGLNVVFDAAEESGSAEQLLGRMFLKAARPFTIHLSTADGTPALKLTRPFRFLFHEVEIHDTQGRLLGSVKRQFSVLSKRYLVHGTDGEAAYEILGPLLRPWTFKILSQGEQCGLICKKWSGLGKESFTDADNFGVEFPAGISTEMKAVFLGAVFLIDFAHFEDNN